MIKPYEDKDEWQITPTTATETAKAKAETPSATTEDTEVSTTEITTEDSQSSSPLSAINALWGVVLPQKQAQRDAAQKAMTSSAKEVEDMAKKLAEARENKWSVYKVWADEQKPVYDEDKARKLKNRALVKSLGDVLSAVASGAHAYGKRGAGVVPTLASNSPLKDVEKINEMQKEYLKRKEAWKALEGKVRLGKADEDYAEGKTAYEKAVAKMDKAKTAYDTARKAYDDAIKGYGDDMLDLTKEEWKQDRADARVAKREAGANYRASIKGNGNKKTEKEDALFLDWYDILEPWEPRDVITEKYDMTGELEGYSKQYSKYKDDVEDRKREAKRNVVLKRAKVLYETGEFTKDEALIIAIGENLKAKGMPEADRQLVLRYMQQGYDYKEALAMVARNKKN